jgi:hypothetical protein
VGSVADEGAAEEAVTDGLARVRSDLRRRGAGCVVGEHPAADSAGHQDGDCGVGDEAFGMASLISILIAVVVVIVVAYLAHYVITTFFPPPIQQVALIVVGLILLIVILWLVAGYADLPWPDRRR